MKTRKRRRQNGKNQKKARLSTESCASRSTIDDLPESILLQILSFLPTTTAVKTTAVASDWCNLWFSVPKLDFDMSEFHLCIPDKTTRDARQLFAEFVSRTLLHRPRHFPIEKFKLFFSYLDNESIRSYVNFWLRYVINCRALELDLNFDCFDYRPPHRSGREIEDQDEDDDMDYGSYTFHFTYLINSSVKVLRLYGGSIDFCSPGNALSMAVTSLREIYLEDFHSANGEIENMVALCVNLEILSIVNVRNLRNLRMVSRKLRRLELSDFREFKTEHVSLELCAPSLESVKFFRVYSGKYALKDMSSLVEAHVKFRKCTWWDLACWTNLVSFLRGVT